MALAAGTIWETQTGGSDTANAGAFDPSRVVSNAAIGAFTDWAVSSANTSAPVVTSASYTFLAGDVGAWWYLASGTNGVPGWYKIASVTGGAATLNAAIGAALLANGSLSVAVGCSASSSLTSQVAAIDYSQQTAARFSYTDLASAGAGLTVSSAASPFGRQDVGNGLIIASGTNFTAGIYVISTVSAAVATVLGAGNITTGAGASGVGGMGGALVSPGKVGGFMVSTNYVWVKSGTYSIANTSANTSGGPVSSTANASNSTRGTKWVGYDSVRGDSGARPLIQVASSGVTAITIFSVASGSGLLIKNIDFDGQSKSTIKGVSLGTFNSIQDCKISNCTNNGLVVGTNSVALRVEVTGCSTADAISLGANTLLADSSSHGNSVSGVICTSNIYTIKRLLSYGNSGAGSHGINMSTLIGTVLNCTCYGNGGSGLSLAGNGGFNSYISSSIFYGNGALGISSDGVKDFFTVENCAFGNNTSGNYTVADLIRISNPVTLSANPFTNAASGDFSLNSTEGGGAACRAVGIPGIFPGGLTTGYLDIGASQHQDSGGGGGLTQLAGFGGGLVG